MGTHVVPRVYATPDVPGIGGVLKQRPEDFLVDEQPQYQPVGEGEHIYMLVQKRGFSTVEMLAILARHFGVPRGAVGYAGLKDKHAVTRQVVSVHTPGRTWKDFPVFRHDQIEILWADMHVNKLRPGHLRGNRFSVKVRGVSPTDVVRAKAILERLKTVGVPNRVGEQRFGLLGNNHHVGRAIVTGDNEGAVRALLGPCERHPEVNAQARAAFVEGRYREAITLYPAGARTEMIVLNALAHGMDARAALRRIDAVVVRYYISAFQSAVLNAVLDERVAEGSLGMLAAGDVALKHINQAAFTVDQGVANDPATAARLASFEISPTGPMWGANMLRGSGETDVKEVAALARVGVTPDHLLAFDADAPGMLEGKRRALRVPLIDPEVEGGLDEHGPYIRCAFELPRGSFATVVMREVMKPEREIDLDSEE